MADSDKESTDKTSIKPVSSLLSHFERIGSISPAPVTSSRASPRFDADSGRGQKEHGFPERASLDIPRRSFPWAIAKDGSAPESQQGAKPMGPPVIPRTARPQSALFHHPKSTKPTAPLEPPLVTIVSPKSPPNSIQLSHASSVPQLPSPKFTSMSGLGSRPAPPVPPQEQRVPVKSPVPVRKFSAANNIDTTLANAPPLVNRADKPKIPVKPSESNDLSTLEPNRTKNDDRVSPFSTPPSSDESPARTFQLQGSKFSQSVPINSPNRIAIPPSGPPTDASPTARGISPFSPPAAQDVLRQPNRPSGFPLSSKVTATDNFSQPKKNTRSAEEARPGLPPRRMTEKDPQPQTISSSQARIASTSKIARQLSQPVSVPPVASSPVSMASPPTSDFLPPPKRIGTSDGFDSSKVQSKSSSPMPTPAPYANDIPSSDYRSDASSSIVNASEYPDASQSNRRPPGIKQGIREIDTNYDTRLFDFCGDYLCTTGYLTRAWDLSNGNAIMSLGHGEQTKVTALAFKPGTTAEEEGLRLWMGTNFGDMYEVDILTQTVISTKSSAHNRREIIKIYRHQNSMWSLDDGGSLHVWPPDKSGLPNVQSSPMMRRVPKGHTFSIAIHHTLWLATGKDIRIFSPASRSDADFQLTIQPLTHPNAGEVTSGAVISSQHDRVYFGHTDGKVTIYSIADFSCLGIVNLSVYKINSLVGAGDYLWAGYNTGMIYVYDTRSQPWRTKKDWHAHGNPVSSIMIDRSSVWKAGILQVASIGTDNAVRIWDGMLEEDWLDNDMNDHDTEYCSFQELRALVVTWNAGAATPTNLRYEEKNSNFFRDVLGVENPPDLVVYGFQELVDLEDKKLTAKSLFKGNKKKDTEHEHMSRQYRAWRDHLVMNIEDSMPTNEPYHLLHTASMVGLFSCVFVRSSVRNRVSNLGTAEVKRGMGGLHGNKGCLILRFHVDDSSLCLINCHLAAGQTQTVHRNTDVSAIIESVVFPSERNRNTRCDSYSGGGDGSMILDHEICILNGDLNYRIDTMPRDTVVKAVQAQNFAKLLERDQLLVSRRRNPGFRLRAFAESPITFAPTYKYDVGTDRYDTSEKHRAPAWCDRILYRGPGKIKQLDYRRHELKVSDHRPVSATFKMRIKSVSQEKRATAWQACMKRFEAAKNTMARNEKVIYLRDVLGVNVEEARSLV